MMRTVGTGRQEDNTASLSTHSVCWKWEEGDESQGMICSMAETDTCRRNEPENRWEIGGKLLNLEIWM